MELDEKVNLNENDVCAAILKHGEVILRSDAFRQAASQTHHLRGTVLDHTLNVCIVSMWLCRQLKDKGKDVNEKDLVQAALCHDLGMLDRENKYKDRINSWREHPKESARIARELVPDLSVEAEQMILSHMWPVAGSPPRSKEAKLLCMADKYASMADWKSFLTKRKFADHVKAQLSEALK